MKLSKKLIAATMAVLIGTSSLAVATTAVFSSNTAFAVEAPAKAPIVITKLDTVSIDDAMDYPQVNGQLELNEDGIYETKIYYLGNEMQNFGCNNIGVAATFVNPDEKSNKVLAYKIEGNPEPIVYSDAKIPITNKEKTFGCTITLGRNVVLTDETIIEFGYYNLDKEEFVSNQKIKVIPTKVKFEAYAKDDSGKYVVVNVPSDTTGADPSPSSLRVNAEQKGQSDILLKIVEDSSETTERLEFSEFLFSNSVNSAVTKENSTPEEIGFRATPYIQNTRFTGLIQIDGTPLIEGMHNISISASDAKKSSLIVAAEPMKDDPDGFPLVISNVFESKQQIFDFNVNVEGLFLGAAPGDGNIGGAIAGFMTQHDVSPSLHGFGTVVSLLQSSNPLTNGSNIHFPESKAPEAQQGAGSSTMQSHNIEEILASNKIHLNSNGLSASSLTSGNFNSTLNQMDDGQKEKMFSQFNKLFGIEAKNAEDIPTLSFSQGIIFMMYSGITGMNSESAN